MNKLLNKLSYLAVFMAFLTTAAQGAEKQYPVVIELFTSQSCSSCPPADALLKRISETEADVLPLSFHVDYWDYLSWKDTYSAPEYTQRQRDYDKTLNAGVFTPQLVVNGATSALGSSDSQVNDSIASARQKSSGVKIGIAKKGTQLVVTISGKVEADIWEVRYDKLARTEIKAGENGGRVLESVNNVTSIKKLPFSLSMMIDAPESGNLAILVQARGQGPILAAAVWN